MGLGSPGCGGPIWIVEATRLGLCVSAELQRFREYLDRLARALEHADRREPLRPYLTGLCLPGERKSIEPMAARIDPRHVRARHQSIHHLVANAPWDDAAALRIARGLVLAEMDRHEPVAAWLVDDTAFPKRGQHSGGRGASILRPLGQAGQLSGGRDRHVDERSGQRADGLPAVPAGELGAGPDAAASGSGAAGFGYR